MWFDVDLTAVARYGQRKLKYWPVEAARAVVCPPIVPLLDQMLTFVENANFVDVKWWPLLRAGELPALPAWHCDVYAAVDDPRGADVQHALWFSGAGSRTEFRDGIAAENTIWLYGHGYAGEHRPTPATFDGPRLLVRVTRAPLFRLGRS